MRKNHKMESLTNYPEYSTLNQVAIPTPGNIKPTPNNKLHEQDIIVQLNRKMPQVFRYMVKSYLMPPSPKGAEEPRLEKIQAERKSWTKLLTINGDWYLAFHQLFCEDYLYELGVEFIDIKNAYFKRTPISNFIACLNESLIDQRLHDWGKEVNVIRSEDLSGIVIGGAGVGIAARSFSSSSKAGNKSTKTSDEHFWSKIAVIAGVCGVAMAVIGGYKFYRSCKKTQEWRERDEQYKDIKFEDFESILELTQANMTELILYGKLKDPQSAKTMLLWLNLYQECRKPKYTDGPTGKGRCVVAKECLSIKEGIWKI